MATDGDLRRTVLVVGGLSILGVLVLAGATGYLSGPGTGPATEQREPTLVQPDPIEGEFWPYTSRSRSVGGRTLAINLVFVGDADQVRRAVSRQAAGNWTTRSDPTVADDEPVGILNLTGEEVIWHPAHGSTRYGYVRAAGGTGQWIDATYQLYDGSYLGARHHLRAYHPPDGHWTAVQGHREYWDWFRLRHTVTSIADTQTYVDTQLLEDPRVESVTKVHLGNGRSADGDGWGTIVEFAGLAVLVLGVGGRGSVATHIRDRLSSGGRAHVGRLLALFGAVLALYLGVRVGGVAIERALGDVSPKVVAGVLYPVLAVGLPYAAFRLGRGLYPEDAFATAIAGLVGGFVLEYAYLGLTVVPVALLLHRVAVLLSLGLLATAGALGRRTDDGRRQLLALGVAGWIAALGFPLLGLV